MSNSYKSLLIYILKCIAGILLCYSITLFIHRVDYTWCIISVVLVLSPDGGDALNLAITRIGANLVGAGTGLILLFFDLPHPVNICIGAAMALFLCNLSKLNAGAKSSLAAVIIILLHKEGSHIWDTAMERVMAVGLGCLMGLIVTYTFHSLFHIKAPAETFKPVNITEDKEA